MPSWFNKVFKSEAKAAPEESPKPEAARSYALRSPAPAASTRALRHSEELPGRTVPKERQVIEPTLLLDESEPSSAIDGIRIKAQIEKDGRGCVFMVDRPVLDGYSAWFPVPQAAAESTLAQAIFGVEGVDSVLIHGMNITVGRNPLQRDDWEGWAKEIGGHIRAQLKSGEPVVSETYLQSMPSEDEVRTRLQRILDTEINPGIAAHSGEISLERVEGNTVFIRMMGGCQGCAASTITLRQGIHQAFREAVPQVGAILDQTDHSSGKNPFYRQLPAGMSADA